MIGAIQNIDYRLFSVELINSNRLPPELEGAPLKPNVSVVATTSDFSVVYTINSKSIRDKEHPYEKTKGLFRIVLIGDSFTFGEGIPYGKRYSDIAERNLEAEIITMGVPGLGLGGMAWYALTEGIKYNPDLMVFAINNLVTARGESDITQYFPSASESGFLKELQQFPEIADPSTVNLLRTDSFFSQNTNGLVRWSYVLSYARYTLLKHQLMAKMKNTDRIFWDLERKGQVPGIGEGELKGTDLTERTNYIIEKLSGFLQELQIPLLLINIDKEHILNLPPILPSDVKYCDFSDKLSAASKADKITFTYDQHYNEKTHELLAELFTNCIRVTPGILYR